ncbi:MAG TPA: folylpolyglutamate synthase/dihydrofolate synthase family protein [Gemmatimonadaceae bacterium]
MVSGLNEYRVALDALFARTGSTAKFGLERTEALLERLGNPHRRLKVFHVAGTNGKGSVVATLDTLLRTKSLRVGRYTSPHLVDFRERIVVDGEKIPETEVVEFIRGTERESERLGATFFEITTVLAFDWFAKQNVDVAVIETGLGGRLDSTNVVSPLVAGITSVSIDHTEYLGDTIESIAREKAGILKEGRPGVLGPLMADARDVIARVAREKGVVKLVDATEMFTTTDVAVASDGTRFAISHNGRTATVTSGLFGAHQAANTSVALSMLQVAGEPYSVSLEDAAIALPDVILSGRFQRIDDVILDVAHNPEGIASLVGTVRAVEPVRPLGVVVGVLADKDWRSMLESLALISDLIVLTNPPGAPADRRWDIEDVARTARELSLEVAAAPVLADALQFARARCATTLVTGSFYTVGGALELLGASP